MGEIESHIQSLDFINDTEIVSLYTERRDTGTSEYLVWIDTYDGDSIKNVEIKNSLFANFRSPIKVVGKRIVVAGSHTVPLPDSTKL